MSARLGALLPLLLFCACTQEPQRAHPKTPNILLIVADDHAAHALSCYGSELDRTPNLDRLAAQGARFVNAFVTNALCGPSRACILTGKYGHHNGFVRNGQEFDASQWTVARELQGAGYRTAVIGKWHLGADPRAAGFDHGSVLPDQGRYVDPEFLQDGVRRKLPGYVTDVITDQAIDWLGKRAGAQPFFLMVGHKAPHREWTPPPALAAEYRARRFPEPATLFDDYATRLPGAKSAEMTVARHLTPTDLKQQPPPGLQGRDLVRWQYQRYLQDYLACVRSLDDNVGRLLDWLDSHGLGEDTVVVYTSDNGFFLGDHGWYDKRWMYEESLRVPLLVRWPGLPAGRVPGAFALNIDLAPTFLDIAGVPVPPGVQGESLGPMLHDRLPIEWRQVMYYRYYEFPGTHSVPQHWGVRSHTHKLIWYPELKAWEMFDVEHDPHELNNVIADPEQQGYRRHLEGELQRLRAALGDDDQVKVR